MINYDYKVLEINYLVVKLINGEKLINQHTQYKVLDPKSSTLWSPEKREFIKRFGENEKDWKPFETKEPNPDWRNAQVIISEAEDVFNTYKTLMGIGYKLHTKDGNTWTFERSYEGDYIPDILLLEEELKSQKLQHKQKDLAIEAGKSRIKKLELQQNEATETIKKYQSNVNELANKLLVSKSEVGDKNKLILTLENRIKELTSKTFELEGSLSIATNRAEHLEISLDEVTNNNHLLRAQIKSLEEKTKKKGWFK